jgi:cobalt-zinc-cadmium efflux system outer membrane protein
LGLETGLPGAEPRPIVIGSEDSATAQTKAEVSPPVLSLDGAINWALQNNPELIALRQQHGIAAAAVVIAQTYPYNPVWEAKVRAANGPVSAGITNRVSNEHKVFVDVEIRGQGTQRRQAAYAALSRTDWEIAFQELTVAVRVLRAFNGVLYRREKQRLIEETVNLNQRTVKQLTALRKANPTKFTQPDLILARTEEVDARTQEGLGRANLALALLDLRRSLGLVNEAVEIRGSLEGAAHEWDAAPLLKAAMEQRADLHARQAAVSEADARLRLADADRYGNPNLGPAYEYDPTRINLIGIQWTLPLPVFNTRRGEILQRRAERTRAALDLRNTEVVVKQDVHAALERLDNARAWVKSYQTEVLPALREALKDTESLFEQTQADVLRLIDVRRKLLRARDGYLDALWEESQARADLAAAVGDPSLGVNP